MKKFLVGFLLAATFVVVASGLPLQTEDVAGGDASFRVQSVPVDFNKY